MEFPRRSIAPQPPPPSGERVVVPRSGLGPWGEALAERLLVRKGYAIQARHWTCRAAELDIIAWAPRREALVFVEVKTRRTLRYGQPEASIGTRQQRSLRRAIEWYCLKQKYRGPIRCDVIAIYAPPGERVTVKHLRGVALA